ncbi:hypothetical protein [Chitinophaga rhizophila]|uniref:HTH cro/C1-type domain-containing protein n=1 Tax=Chitinophaga rhizophila TaxID=2866212 RepID=A0ABS7G7B9_9BACT|nr:hypothetical protein [Chitinophaga rhizophila]MBW8683546.1 hypothetical protein [Chitinophaga rhizophila]
MSKTPIDQFIIDKVKEIREKQDVSQEKLSVGAGYYKTLVANAERLERPEKYNIYHLNSFAKILKCSIKEFFPDEPM